MFWQPMMIALVFAVLITSLTVPMLGWRRPTARPGEGAMLSAAFLFTLLFLVMWASAAWLRPVGPVVWGVPWLVMLVLGAVAALLVLAGSTGGDWVAYNAAREPAGSDQLHAANSGSAAVAATRMSGSAVQGFGMLFWLLVVMLLFAAVFAQF